MNIVEGFNSITYSRGIARQLGLKENDIWRLLSGTKISTSRFLYDDSPIDDEDQKAIFENAVNLSQNTAYGLELGQTLTPSSHGIMGFLANCSPTLYSALEDFSLYLPTRVSFGRMGLRSDENSISCLLYVSYEDQDRINHVIVDAFAVSVVILIENILGQTLIDGEVHFKHKKPDFFKQYSHHIKCRLLFNQAENKIIIPGEYRHYPNIYSDFNTYQIYKNECRRQLTDIKSTSLTDTDRVMKQLLLSPPGKALIEEEVAASMFISKRTLARRLSKEGTSYREISNNVLNTISKTYLEDTNISIDNIAVLLGYSDTSSFRRVFKKLNVVSPSEYRKNFIEGSK